MNKVFIISLASDQAWSSLHVYTSKRISYRHTYAYCIQLQGFQGCTCMCVQMHAAACILLPACACIIYSINCLISLSYERVNSMQTCPLFSTTDMIVVHCIQYTDKLLVTVDIKIIIKK